MSMRKALEEQYGKENIIYPAEHYSIGKAWKEIRCRKIQREMWSFGFVRNPWARAWSIYQGLRNWKWHKEHIGESDTFEHWVRHYLAKRINEERAKTSAYFDQYHFVSNGKGVAVDFIGRFESIEADWPKVCREIGIDTALPLINVSPQRNWRDQYSPKLADIVGNIYKRDVISFGYGFKDG